MFQCPFLAHARNQVKGWLEIAGIDQDHFNRHTKLIEMTEVDALQNNDIVISNYKDIILKNVACHDPGAGNGFSFTV